MHRIHLLKALELAEKNRGFCAPNPAVGAVLAKDGQTIAEGYHAGPGKPHAEAALLDRIGSEALRDSTLYVTLEPCCHWGRTPPCTQLILAKSVPRVVFSELDPNPKVSGKGMAELREAGVNVSHETLPEVSNFYRSYRHWTQTGRPFVTAKLAMSLDGKIAEEQGKPVSLSQKTINDFTHSMRKRSDAILTSSRTVLSDNPKLNARTDGTEYAKPIYILDSWLRLEPTSTLLKTAEKVVVFYEIGKATGEKLDALTRLGVQCLGVASNAHGLDLHAVMNRIGKDGVHDLWVEAGGKCLESLVFYKLVDRTFLYVCPKWLGGQATPAFSKAGSHILSKAKNVQWIPFGRDTLCDISW